MITQDQRALLGDVISDSRPQHIREKINLTFDQATRTVTMVYWDFDDEDFQELQRLGEVDA